jgi:hypothetical protein
MNELLRCVLAVRSAVRSSPLRENLRQIAINAEMLSDQQRLLRSDLVS